MLIIIKLIIGLLISYILGSIPTAYLFGKLARGIDLRKCGSGNLGATNAFRVLGKTIGITVLILDILKGTLAVLLSTLFFYDENTVISEHLYACLSAIIVVAGHNWTMFLGFKGGKGIATSLGSLIAFSILIPKFSQIVIIVICLWILVFLGSGFVSLASIISSLTLPILSILFKLPIEIVIFVSIIATFSIIRHKSNIYRLLCKKESRFNPLVLLTKIFKKQ